MLARIGVVVVEQVQDAVHDEQRDLVVGGPAVLGRLRGRDLRADDDVADEARRLAAPRPGAPGPRPPWSGWRPAEDDVVVHREREDVGRAGPAQEPLVQVGDRLQVHEDQRELGHAGHPLLGEHDPGQPDPAHHVDLDDRLLVRPEATSIRCVEGTRHVFFS